jgi:hypothetical protein
VRAVWPLEPTHFTPWLGEHLEFLDDLGLGELSLVKIEAMLPGLGRSLDILAETTDGRRVAVENQYDRVDHDHLTRGLAYAVGHEARALIVIAEEHRPEFIAVADYLNRCQESLGDEHGIAVFLVALSAERVDDAYIPRFTVLSRPNAWRAAVAAAESGRFATTEDFLAACDETTRLPADRVLREWCEHPGSSVRFSKTGVSLDVRNPTKAGGGVTSVFVLSTNGQITLNRGYLVDGALIRDPFTADLDAQIHAVFPNSRWGKASYYVTVGGPPDPTSVRTFHIWLDAQIEELVNTG